MTSTQRPLQTWSMLIFLAAIWGGSFLFIRIAAPSLGSIFLMAVRVALAATGLFVYALAQKAMPNFRAHWKHYLVIGALNNAIPFVLIANAVIDLNASLSAILNATTPLFTALVAAVWIGEPFGWRRGLGVLLGILGVVILVGFSPIPFSTKVLLAAAQSLLAALSYGLGAVYTRTRFQGANPVHTSLGQLVGSTILLAPLAAFSVPVPPPTVAVILATLALALLGTSFAYLIYFRLITAAGPTTAVSVTFLVPFFSILWGVIFLHEPLSPGMFLGLGIILGSVGLVLNQG
jgi:drug/metabolite transporter (DMT)-like permease